MKKKIFAVRSFRKTNREIFDKLRQNHPTLTASPVKTAVRNGWIFLILIGMWIVFARCPCKPLQNIIKNGAAAKSTASANQKRKKSTE